jgi:hypothetical protein
MYVFRCDFIEWTKPSNCPESLTNVITLSCSVYTLSHAEIKHIPSTVIGTEHTLG